MTYKNDWIIHPLYVLTQSSVVLSLRNGESAGFQVGRAACQETSPYHKSD